MHDSRPDPDALLAHVGNRRDPIERRLRKCLHLAAQMRKARLDDVRGSRLRELVELLASAADSAAVAVTLCCL